MKYASQILIAVTIVSLFLVTALPTTAFCAEFTADLIRSTEGDADTSKIFIKGKLRREEIMEDGEVHTVTITRPDKGVTWNLMPDDEMYMEIPLGGMNAGAMEDIEGLESRAKVKVLGKETLSGYACEKRQYDYNNRTQGSVTVWYSSKLDFPVKIYVMPFGGEEGMTLEYKNIKTGKIPDSKFEIPQEYEKFVIPGMPAGMPSGMPGGMPNIPGIGR